jgi:hypothetical protein
MTVSRPSGRLRWLWTAVLAAVLCGHAVARNGSEPLNYYGLVTLSDPQVGARLAARFKSRGQPVFLVHDINAGLSRNDIMRFQDRAVLVDADVWSTLAAEGALEKLKASPVIRVQGRATSALWAQRAELVAGDRQKKTFKLGAEILRVLEENFGGAPLDDQMTLVFEQGHLTLLAAAGLMDQLTVYPVRRVEPAGNPRIISLPPDSNQFAERPFEFQVWGADPTDPAGDLEYELRGTIPPGLAWDKERHALRGTPTVPGRWAMTAQVRNAAGFRDTMPFVVRFRLNQTPIVTTSPRGTAFIGKDWVYTPQPADADHPGYALQIRPDTMPPGMAFYPEKGSFRWKPDSVLDGTRHPFGFSVEDALGARRKFLQEIRVLTEEGILVSEGVKIELPWDTLMRSRSYRWRTGAIRAAWAGQKIELDSIVGPDSTRYVNDTLYLRPMRAGIHQLDFYFTIQDIPVVQSVLLPVQEDSPPAFVTELTGWKMRSGDPSRQYRPIALDPEGERVTLTAQFPPRSPLKWDGKRVVYTPVKPGLYPARFVARDAGGKTAEQWVTFNTEREMAGAAWILENRMEGHYTAWTLTRDFGTGRLGVYTPNFIDGYKSESYWFKKESPYIFVGGNMMGRKAEAKGRVLWTDLGLNLGIPRPGLYKGGLYMRLNGEWNFPGSPLSWVEMEMTMHVHQAMVATDSALLAKLFKDTTDIIGRDTLSKDGVLSTILRDGYRDDNMRVFFRAEALGPLGWGFYAGPALWREDLPMQERHVQWMGGAVRYRLSGSSNLLQATARVGWTPDEGWAYYTTVRASLGSPF